MTVKYETKNSIDGTTCTDTDSKVARVDNQSAFRSIVGSTAIWLVVILISFDIFLVTIKPLRYVKIPGIILKDQDSLGEQIHFLKGESKNRNVLMFGTSLIRNAAAYADGMSEHREFTQYQWYHYYDAHYCDKMLKTILGSSTKTGTGMAEGGFFYDYWRLLQIAVQSGAKPAVVVLAVAPKDFADSTRTLEDSHVNLFFRLRETKPTEIVDLGSALDAVMRSAWQFYRVRSDYHSVGEVFACSLFDRAPTLYAALHEKVVKRPEVGISFEDEKIDLLNPIKPEIMATHVKYYRSVYDTTRPDSRELQYGYLKEALTFCKKNGIICIVVNMPMTEKHNSMMSEELKESYLSNLRNICSENDTKFIDLFSSPRFSEKNFVDVVHLNGTGATLFWDTLGSEISKDEKFRVELKTALSQTVNAD